MKTLNQYTKALEKEFQLWRTQKVFAHSIGTILNEINDSRAYSPKYESFMEFLVYDPTMSGYGRSQVYVWMKIAKLFSMEEAQMFGIETCKLMSRYCDDLGHLNKVKSKVTSKTTKKELMEIIGKPNAKVRGSLLSFLWNKPFHFSEEQIQNGENTIEIDHTTKLVVNLTKTGDFEFKFVKG